MENLLVNVENEWRIDGFTRKTHGISVEKTIHVDCKQAELSKSVIFHGF